MRALTKMTWTEIKLYLREPAAVFFTLAFPLLLLFIFGSIYGNNPVETFNGYGNVDVSVPGYIGMIIGTIGLIGIPITLANYREQGILKRYRATPLHPNIILGAQVLVNVAIQILGTGFLIAAAWFVYDLRFPSADLAVVPAVLIGGLSFFAVGFVLAGLMPTGRTAQAVGMALLFPMLFLSGAAMPRQTLPDTMQRISEFLPLTHVVVLIEDLWFYGDWNLPSLAVVLGLLIAGIALSAQTFRWE